MGFRVTSSPIDDCATSGHRDDCGSSEALSGRGAGAGGGCSSVAVITGEPRLVNTNQTSVVGLDVYIRSECACAARTFADITPNTQCHADTCLNGGTCYELEYSVMLVLCIHRLITLACNCVVHVYQVTVLLRSFLPERDYVTFRSLLSQIRLSSTTFVRPSQGVETFGNIFRHFVP